MEFEDLKDTAEGLLQRYEAEYNDAKSLGMDNLFPVQPKTIKSLLSDTEKLIEDGDLRNALYKVEKEIPDAIDKMDDTLEMLMGSAYSMLDEVDSHLATRRHELSGEQIAEIEDKRDTVEALLAGGDYVKAIKEGTDTINYIKELKAKGNLAFYLVLASIVLVALIVIYIMQQKKKKPKMKILGKEKSQSPKE